jgi:hypothetical protein
VAGKKRKPPPKVNPAALSAAELAKLLTAAGGQRVTPADVRAAISAGAPTNDDGTLHLLHFTAWLAAAA